MHIKNFTKAQKGHILTHNENADVRSRLKHVDKEKTCLNYNLCPREVSAIEYWQERYEQSKHSNQKKTSVMTDIVITQPQGLTEEQSKQFFKETYAFISKRYGEENMVSAWVHRDEATPHIHICMLPINKETNRCSARGVFSKEELQAVHSDFQKYLDDSLDFKANVLNGATSGGNKTIQELKAESLAKENRELQDRLREERIKLKFLQGELEELQGETQREETRNKAVKEVYADMEERVNLEKENKALKARMAEMIPKEEYEELDAQADLMAKYIQETGQETRFISYANSKYSDIERDL